MKRKLHLHIGLAKAGTTAIQRFFKKNRSCFAEQGVLYPIVPGVEQHVGLRLYSQNRPIAYDDLNMRMLSPQKLDRFDKLHFAEAFRDEIESTAAKQIILSSEFLSLLESESEIQTLQALLHKVSSDISVIVYLRRQDERYVSDYAQLIKAGAIISFDQDDCSKWNPFLPSQLDYDRLLNRWAAVFGDERVIVRVYERDKLIDGDVVLDFLHTADISNLAYFYKKEDRNPALDRHQLEFIRLFNSEMSRRPESAASFPYGRLIKALEISVGSDKLRLPDHKRSELLARYEQGNLAVRDRFRPDLRQGLFSEPPASNDPGSLPSLSLEQAVTIGTSLWLTAHQRNLELEDRVRGLERELKKLEKRRGQAKRLVSSLARLVRFGQPSRKLL